MARGRKPLPSHLKLVKGNPGRRPLNENEPKPPIALPEAPPHLTDEAKAEWARVCPRLYNVGLMTELDRAVLAAYCQAWARWVTAENALAEMAKKDPRTSALMMVTSNGNAIQNPLVGIANTAMQEMTKYATEFGMTPSARSRIDVSVTPAEAGQAKTGLASFRR